MRLTPADVHNVAFKKPSIGKRGYDEDEVDAFLDLVEAELARLIEENNELNQQAAGLKQALADCQSAAQQAAVQAPQAEAAPQPAVALVKEPEPTPPAPAPAPEPVAQPVAAAAPQDAQPVAAAAPSVAQAGPADHHLHAAKLLGLAQETAERLTSDAAAEAETTRNSARTESERMLSEARNESEKLVNDAKTESERMLTSAKNDSEKMLSEAKAQSEAMVNDATNKAQSLERDSRIRAEAMDREAQGKYSQVMTQLTESRTGLERKIDDLRTYEREYRSRLKGWITDQLSQLDDDGGSPKADSTPATQQG